MKTLESVVLDSSSPDQLESLIRTQHAIHHGWELVAQSLSVSSRNIKDWKGEEVFLTLYSCMLTYQGEA